MNKKRLLWMLALLAVVAFIYLRPQKETAEPTEIPSTVAGETEINILSVNDMHSSIDMFAKFVALVDSLRGEHQSMAHVKLFKFF